jgi:hypothetical protein
MSTDSFRFRLLNFVILFHSSLFDSLYSIQLMKNNRVTITKGFQVANELRFRSHLDSKFPFNTSTVKEVTIKIIFEQSKCENDTKADIILEEGFDISLIQFSKKNDERIFILSRKWIN